MLEELKKMNKQYYDEYEENDCNIDDRDGESRIPVNGEIHKETKIQQLMFKIIIFVAVFLTSLGIVVLSKEQRKQKEIESLKEKLTEKNDIAEEKKKEVLENNVKLGLTNLRGEGIELVLKDGEDKKKVGNDALQIIVHDTDILEIVNVLRNAGAEAISINDQRVIATTPISCIGTVIKINDEKLGGPYVIRAIGNSDYLKTALEIPGGILRILESSRNRC